MNYIEGVTTDAASPLTTDHGRGRVEGLSRGPACGDATPGDARSGRRDDANISDDGAEAADR